MSDAADSVLPFPTPPSIGQSVTEYLQVIDQIREARADLELLIRQQQSTDSRLATIEKAVVSLAGDVHRLANSVTVTDGTLQRLELLMQRMAVKLRVTP